MEQDDLLLTDKELQKLAAEHTTYDHAEFIYVGRRIIKAQLTKAEPLIRREERERIIADLKKHLTRVSSEGIAFYFTAEDYDTLNRGEL